MFKRKDYIMIHYLYSYLIAGLACAAVNDIFIIDGLIKKEHVEMPLIDQIICRVCIVFIVTIGWLPLLIYEMFFWKGPEE